MHVVEFLPCYNPASCPESFPRPSRFPPIPNPALPTSNQGMSCNIFLALWLCFSRFSLHYFVFSCKPNLIPKPLVCGAYVCCVYVIGLSARAVVSRLLCFYSRFIYSYCLFLYDKYMSVMSVCFVILFSLSLLL